MSAEQRLIDKGITLPPPWADKYNRVRAQLSGIHVYMSGHGPLAPDSTPLMVGKLGREFGVEQGAAAARLAALATLATLKHKIGSLDRVVRVVKVLGFVNCAPGFNTPSMVMHGFSDVMVDVFGEEIGKHARSSIGIAELYADMPVEIETIFEIAPD
ncbi:RidA family protein [soil metagenome]